MWYNAGIRNNQRAFIHCHNVAMYINFIAFDCPCVCVCHLDWPPSLFPPFLLPTKLTKNWKLESKVLPSYVYLPYYWIGLTLNNNNRWQKFTVEFSNKYDSYVLVLLPYNYSLAL